MDSDASPTGLVSTLASSDRKYEATVSKPRRTLSPADALNSSLFSSALMTSAMSVPLTW
jgi:hypothetical protein